MFDWVILAEPVKIIPVKVYGISVLLFALLIAGACSSKINMKYYPFFLILSKFFESLIPESCKTL